MPTVSETEERLLDRSWIRQQIAADHHERPVSEHGRHLHQTAGDVGLPGGSDLREHREHLRDLRPPGAGWQLRVNLLVKNHQPAGILLVDHQPAEGGRQ